MKQLKSTAFLIALLTVSGCSDMANQEAAQKISVQPSMAITSQTLLAIEQVDSIDVIAPVEEKNVIPLNFHLENFNQKNIAISKSMVEEILQNYEFDGCEFIIFQKSDDLENAHSGVMIDERIYDFGEVSALFSAKECKIEQKNIYGENLIKIMGSFGAIYAPSEYYAINSNDDGKFPQFILRIENYNNIEIDLDGDGIKEIFEFSMSGAIVHKYDDSSHRFYCADLIEDTGAVQVTLEDNNLLQVNYGNDRQLRYFSYSSKELSEVTETRSYAGHWEIIDRLRYIEGSVDSLHKNTDGTATLYLSIVQNFHSGTDPVGNPDFPFHIGESERFILPKMPDATLTKGDNIVILECGMVAPNMPDRFVGAVIRYIKTDKGYENNTGKIISMPPDDFPQNVYEVFP